MSDLKPCPHCGGKRSLDAMWVDWSYRVVCLPPGLPDFEDHGGVRRDGCGAMGAGQKTARAAIAAWNRRAPAQGVEG